MHSWLDSIPFVKRSDPIKSKVFTRFVPLALFSPIGVEKATKESAVTSSCQRPTPFCPTQVGFHIFHFIVPPRSPWNVPTLYSPDVHLVMAAATQSHVLLLLSQILQHVTVWWWWGAKPPLRIVHLRAHYLLYHWVVLQCCSHHITAAFGGRIWDTMLLYASMHTMSKKNKYSLTNSDNAVNRDPSFDTG